MPINNSRRFKIGDKVVSFGTRLIAAPGAILSKTGPQSRHPHWTLLMEGGQTLVLSPRQRMGAFIADLGFRIGGIYDSDLIFVRPGRSGIQYFPTLAAISGRPSSNGNRLGVN